MPRCSRTSSRRATLTWLLVVLQWQGWGLPGAGQVFASSPAPQAATQPSAAEDWLLPPAATAPSPPGVPAVAPTPGAPAVAPTPGVSPVTSTPVALPPVADTSPEAPRRADALPDGDELLRLDGLLDRLEALEQDRQQQVRELQRGAVWLALSLAVGLLGQYEGRDDEDELPFTISWAVVGAGSGLLGLHLGWRGWQGWRRTDDELRQLDRELERLQGQESPGEPAPDTAGTGLPQQR